MPKGVTKKLQLYRRCVVLGITATKPQMTAARLQKLIDGYKATALNAARARANSEPPQLQPISIPSTSTQSKRSTPANSASIPKRARTSQIVPPAADLPPPSASPAQEPPHTLPAISPPLLAPPPTGVPNRSSNQYIHLTAGGATVGARAHYSSAELDIPH